MFDIAALKYKKRIEQNVRKNIWSVRQSVVHTTLIISGGVTEEIQNCECGMKIWDYVGCGHPFLSLS